MKLSITSTAAGLLALASSTSACRQAYIGYDFVSSTIQFVIIYDKGGFICHLWNLHITREKTSYPPTASRSMAFPGPPTSSSRIWRTSVPSSQHRAGLSGFGMETSMSNMCWITRTGMGRAICCI